MTSRQPLDPLSSSETKKKEESTFTRLVYGLIACAAYFAVFLFREVSVAQRPQDIPASVLNGCDVAEWGEFRTSHDALRTMFDWRPECGEKDIRALMNHMRIHAPPGQDVVFASEFGSNMRLAYYAPLGLTVLNPYEEAHSPDTITCRVRFSNIVMHCTNWPKWARVVYINERLEETKRVFKGKEICMLYMLLRPCLALSG